MDINSVSLGLGANVALQGSRKPALENDTPSAAPGQANSAFEASESEGLDVLSIHHTTTPGQASTREERIETSLRSLEILGRQLPSETAKLDDKLATLEDAVKEELPEVSSSEWDFSIDENGRAVVVGDLLSDQEKSTIASIIDKSGIGSDVEKVRDLMIEGLEANRGPDKYSNNIGKYDLHKENFSDTIRVRGYEGTWIKPQSILI